jgi:serine/threonine protein kinase
MVVGGNPRYIPPEVVRTEPSFDAYAADLWAAGIALCRMLFGTDAPFVWASPQDARYTEICVKGNLQGLASNQNSKFGMRPDGDRISAEGIDLIQSMLRANPVDRLSLEHTMQHSWLQGETAVPNFPTPVMKKREE